MRDEIGDLHSARAIALLRAEEAAIRRTAKRFSICFEDAEDAFQRAAEILLTRAPRDESVPLGAWMHVVVRNEALAVRRARTRLLEGDPAAERIAAECSDPVAHVEGRERIAEAAIRLRRLKPQERRALALQAAGCSYAEIQAITGWTYTKTNRCLTEGRAQLRELAPLS